MKRLFFAAVAGLCSFAPLRAQEGTLAPTVPVVPAPVLQNGGVINPAGGKGGWGASNTPRLFSAPKWSPFRSPVAAGAIEPALPPTTVQPMPPLPAGVGGVDGLCGTGNCKTANCNAGGCGHDRSCWQKLKAWLTYHPCKTELPKCQPTPYITPLQGMFPCTANCNYGCGSSCGNALLAGQPLSAETSPRRTPPTGSSTISQPLPTPNPVASAAPVMMPPRGVQGNAMVPALQARTTPMQVNNPAVAGYRFAAPEANVWKPAPQTNTIVNTSARVPQK